MRGLRLSLLILAAGASAPAAAATADCFMSVGGKTLIDGPCRFDAKQGGSFNFGNESWFAIVNVVGPTRAEGFWNEDKGANHAHTPLGALTRKGACWENRTARLCAWKAGSRPK